MLQLHYRFCEPTAQLRKNAVYLMQDVPEVIAKIESGAKRERVETYTAKSVREVQKEFFRRNPEIEKRESVRPITEDRVRVSHSISNELEEKLQSIKLLWSHVDPNMSRERLLDRLADLTLGQIDPLLKAKRAEKCKEKLEVENCESIKYSSNVSGARSSTETPNRREDEPRSSAKK